MQPKLELRKHHQPDTDRIVQAIRCSRLVAQLMANRGITSPGEALSFLYPKLTDLRDPLLLKGMKTAVHRICTAIDNREKIWVFGDFDADGVTSTTILTEFLSSIDASVSWYIPHRVGEGYSLKKSHIATAVDQKIDLIITVDCGSDSHDAIMAAALEDIDVIVIDHHEIRDSIPPAIALVNPKQPECTSGLDHLAGVGVTYYLIIALRSVLRTRGFWNDSNEPNLLQYIDLVAIGTIADMVPMRLENRILAVKGIEQMRLGRRPGLSAILETSRIDRYRLNSDDISYRIAPRINAAGRISHSRICVDLLSSADRRSADQTAAILDQLNTKRQEIELALVRQVDDRLARDPQLLSHPALVLSDPGWNPGVLGIAASKTARAHGRPVILIASGDDPATGSCRSFGVINVYQALERCSAFLEKFGGHAMAAGLTVKHDRIEAFSRAFIDAVNQASDISLTDSPTILYDAVLEPGDITDELAVELDRLRPYGTDNPEPLFICQNLTVVSSVLLGSRHRKMILAKTGQPDSQRIEALQFNLADTSNLPTAFDILGFKIRTNHYNGRTYPQIIVEHAVV